MDPAVETGIEADGVTLSTRDVRLLRAIDERGSLNAAADALGRSYARAHERLEELESAFGPLVERTRGGRDGGGSDLTEGARELLARFQRLRADLSGVAAAEATVLEGTVRDREGELAVVDTDAGPLRAVASGDAEAVQVTLRADTVTLQAPAEAPDADATSAHNRLDGTVVAVDRGVAVARVRVDVGADAALTALVTVDSVERLGLEPGRDVVASFKATATRATGR